MNQVYRSSICILVGAFLSVGLVLNPAFAQGVKDKSANPGYAQKVLLENDKVRVTETSWTPGARGPSVALPVRVLRALRGGTLTRIYPDGKTEVTVWKTGEVKYFDATPEYAVKNTGKTKVVLYGVRPK